MNKQEAIESIKKISEGLLEVKFVSLESVIDIVSQIHEPQKVVVPKFVGEWIERRKLFTLYHVLNTMEEEKKYKNFYKWFSNDVEKNTELLASAWIYGYTVEKEPLYTVEIPNPNSNAHTILRKTEKGIVLVAMANARWKGWEESKLTEYEIKQDFDFLWKFAKHVEDN